MDTHTQYFTSYGSDDPTVLTDKLIADLGLDQHQSEVLYSPIYMAASSFTDMLAAQTRQALVTAKAKVAKAKATSLPSAIQAAEKVEKSAWEAHLDGRFFNGTIDVVRGDATIKDHEAAIAWKFKHQIAPAQAVVKEHEDEIALIKAAGVTTLRQVPRP